VPFSLYRDLLNRALDGESVLLDCSDKEAVVTDSEWRAVGNNDWWYPFWDNFPYYDGGPDWAIANGDIGRSGRWLWSSPIEPPDSTFGAYYGSDGVYLSRRGQEELAGNVLRAINRRYGTNFTLPE
jgi:hypothetical protein